MILVGIMTEENCLNRKSFAAGTAARNIIDSLFSHVPDELNRTTKLQDNFRSKCPD
jgi:hypothetical protein